MTRWSGSHKHEREEQFWQRKQEGKTIRPLGDWSIHNIEIRSLNGAETGKWQSDRDKIREARKTV